MKAPYFLALLVATVSAQNAVIGYPAEGQQIAQGEELVVQVQRPVSWSSLIIASLKFTIVLELPDGLRRGGCRHWGRFLCLVPLFRSKRFDWHHLV
jgi:hypothetical protein